MIAAYVAAIEELDQFGELFRDFAQLYGEDADTPPDVRRFIRQAMRYAYDHAHDDIHACLYFLFLAIFFQPHERLNHGKGNYSAMGCSD